MSRSYQSIPPIAAAFTSFPQPITALSFDPVSDILWAGLQNGNVTAFYSSRGVKGVSFIVGDKVAVHKITAGDNSVMALGKTLGSWTKGGMNKWAMSGVKDLATFSNASNSTHLLAAASSTQEILFVNSATGSIVGEVPTPSLVTQLQFSHAMLLSGSSDGYLRVHDPRTGILRSGGAENLVKAHSGSISGLQTVGNFAFTIGMNEKQARPFADPLVKVYDLRTMRSLPPILFPSGPSFIQILPKRTSSVAVVSNQGLVNIVDASDPSVPNEFHQLDVTSYLTSAAVSPTACFMAFGDADGMIHMLSQVEVDGATPLNGFKGKSVHMGDTSAPFPDITWEDSTPLNLVGLPHYNEPLLSAWTPHFAWSGFKSPPPSRIPPQILNTMKTNDNVSYAAVPKELKGRRNLVSSGPRRGNGRFRSENSQPEPDSATFDSTDSDVPHIYRHVEIEYSKFGVEDFDFGFYNKTEYSGLETHILNSYTNSVVQVMHYTSPIRQLAKSHIATDCLKEHCLLCELGFVSRMLEDARGINCQSSNFCKTVGVLSQESNLIELIDYGRDSVEMDHAHKIQNFHRFLVGRLKAEGDLYRRNPRLLTRAFLGTPSSHPPSSITQLLGIDAKTIIICSSCKAASDKEHVTHIVDLIHPRKTFQNELSFPVDFVTVLRNSLLRNMTHKATCQSCKQSSTFTSRRPIPSRDLPPILALNTGVYDEESFAIWKDTKSQTFLQPRIKLHGHTWEGNDPDSVIYQLRAIVVQITSKERHFHLVSIVKVPEAEQRSDLSSPWFLFNDFVVRNISQEEALSFPDKWKTPMIIYLERVDALESLDLSQLPNLVDTTILSRDTSISVHRDETLVKHELLRSDEFPRPGTLVAIDAEFVSMQQEVTEFRSDGTNKVLRPARLSLARVSVLRGDGRRAGLPFIDDYIHTSEIIVDYLTEFSGIQYGDLDIQLSRYTLTPLKTVYKKLRLLVDQGCIFVGHGLSKDFRIINIFVPPEQVIDTVDLYFLKSRQRRLSLRFLSWFVLQVNIQTITHDSIEDARSALNLYKAFQEFEEQGVFDEKLKELYKEGRQYNFKPPAPSQSTVEAGNELMSSSLAYIMSLGYVPDANIISTRSSTNSNRHPFSYQEMDATYSRGKQWPG